MHLLCVHVAQGTGQRVYGLTLSVSEHDRCLDLSSKALLGGRLLACFLCVFVEVRSCAFFVRCGFGFL